MKKFQRKTFRDLNFAVKYHIAEKNKEKKKTKNDKQNPKNDELKDSIRSKIFEALKPTKLTLIVRKCMIFCLSLLCNEIENDKYDNALICSLTVLSVKHNK